MRDPYICVAHPITVAGIQIVGGLPYHRPWIGGGRMSGIPPMSREMAAVYARQEMAAYAFIRA
jgi:hypothetical protein